ncbi:MAG: hypothetical protein JSS98_19820 [Bacteroidetes bacterium]|nr:hypothetical protein [Bacteroidota bacterium]
MKIGREKRIRAEYVKETVSQIVEQMIRSVEEPEEQQTKRKSYRNICQITGRGRGVIRKYNISRHEYRKAGDRGKLEGVRRAS